MYTEPTNNKSNNNNNNNNNTFLVDVCYVSTAVGFSITKLAVVHKYDIPTYEKETKIKRHKTKQYNVDFLTNNSGLKEEKCMRRKVCNNDNTNNNNSCLFTFWLNSALSVWSATFEVSPP